MRNSSPGTIGRRAAPEPATDRPHRRARRAHFRRRRRQQRLARCRRDLADPAQHTVPIGAIGMRWGYPRSSDFTRAFRAATGTTPSEYRAAGRAGR
ncbi:helix-turn-helix domain-containing protein [Streptomyces sp. NPDC048297]|uniref:helix-turn-helix domain-containing protein n=1 Tax=Streptomyces sp. NPDC048297 TaxID=3365531 RepID=UPI00371D7FED